MKLGIWHTNKFGKRKKRKFKKIKPLVKKCIVCKKRRVTSHHLYCDHCWKEYKLSKFKREKDEPKEF